MAAVSELPGLAKQVIEAHGGAERWSKVSSIEVSLNLSGGALARKGFPGKFQPVCTIDTKTTKVVWQGLPGRDRDDRWTFTPQRAWIERRDGTVNASRDNPYDVFAEHTLTTQWDHLHLLTFGGYAFHNYLTFPFQLLWPGFSSREVEPHEENGEKWRVLEVKFPDNYPTHQKTQLFYFDEAFMLRRNDYGPPAFKTTAAHYCFDVQEISGLKIPMLRRVVLRKPDTPPVDGELPLRGRAWLSGPTSFLLDYVKVVVRDEGQEDQASELKAIQQRL